MKKLTLALYTVWFSAIFNMLPIHSMENDTQFAEQAEEDNANECLLFKLPNEMLFKIFLHRLSDDELSIDSLYDDIKYLIPLNGICKHFNQLITLETIGRLYKKDVNKNEVLQKIIRQLDRSNKDKSLSIFAQVLVHAGADANTGTYAFEVAMQLSEEKLIKTLLEYNADPNVMIGNFNTPIFFKAKTIPIAQMLMDTGKINIHDTNTFGENVLYNITPACYSPALIEFYLDHKVDVTKLIQHNFCILHEFALAYFHYLSDSENMLEKIKILLDVVPHMVNALTKDGKTPIDIAQEGFDITINGVYCGNPSEIAKQKDLNSKDFEKIITLFRNHGGLTAQELTERKPLDSHK